MRKHLAHAGSTRFIRLIIRHCSEHSIFFTGDALASGRAISGIAAVALFALALRNERTGAISLCALESFYSGQAQKAQICRRRPSQPPPFLLAARSPRLAGLSLALALGCRYTALAALPSLYG